jgi:membrane fusion protein (multidrug efflux system)
MRSMVPLRRFRTLLPALAVLGATIAVAAVLLTAPEPAPSGTAGLGGQFGGTVATSVARTADVTEAVRLTGTMAATETVTLVSALAGRVDEVYVEVGDEVRAGASIAHLETVANAPAAYVPAAWRDENTPSGSPSPSPSPSPSTASPAPPPRPSQTPSRGRPSTTRPGGPGPAVTINPPDITINPPDITLPDIKLPDIKLPGGGPTEQTVSAPFAGKVTQLAVVEGGAVAAGTVLATVSGDGLEARAAASPAQAARLAGRTGATATVRAAMPDGATSSATVTSIAPTASATTQQTAVVLSLADGPGRWRPGDPVVVDVGWPAGKGVLVPAEAVVYADGKPAVFRVVNPIDPRQLGIRLPANLPPGLLVGRVALTPVTLGARNGGDRHIRKGIAGGAVVVTRGQTNLVDGVRVAVLDASPAAR